MAGAILGALTGNSQQFATGLGGMLGAALADSIRGNPAEDARRAAEQAAAAEESRRSADELRKQQENLQEEKKNRLLGGMMNVSESPKLALMGGGSGPGLTLMTGDQAGPIPLLDQYKEWEKYKRDVLAYQESLTKSNPGNKENQLWCKTHIPLSTSPNRDNWETRCNPGGQVKLVDSATVTAPNVETSAVRAVPATPALKNPTVTANSHAEQPKTGEQGGLGLKDLMHGEPGVVTKVPETFPISAAPAVEMPTLKEPTNALTGSDEAAKAAAQGGFDSNGPMLGTPGAIPKVPATFPIGTTPVVTTAPAVPAAEKVHSSVPVSPKKTPAKVETQVKTGNQAVAMPKPATKKEPAIPSLKAVAEKQTQALGCAISDFQALAKGMGEEGARLGEGLKDFLNDVRVELNKPCSGEPKTYDIQTLTLSALNKGAKMKEDQLVGSFLVTRNEDTCEVHLHVQQASSIESASSSRSSGQPYNESQSIIKMDKTGKILSDEIPAGVEKCLAKLSAKGQ